MKEYRRIIIIFMMVVINVLVTKSNQLLFEKIAQDMFIKEVTNTPFQIKYGIANHFHNLGIKDIKKAQSKKSFIGYLIYPQKKKEYYDSAIANMICAVATFLDCSKDFLQVIDGIKKHRKKENIMVKEFAIRGRLVLDQTYSAAAELIDTIKQREELEKFQNDTLNRKLGDLIKNMEEYEERINTIFEKCRVSAASRHSQVNHPSRVGTPNVRIIEC